jgi:hypothetical protein
MAGSTADQVSQRDCLGAVATIYRAEGWLVVELHGNKTNPRQMSGPDLLLLKGEHRRVAKCLARSRDDLSEPQEKVRKVYVAAGIDYRVYHAEEFRDVAEDATEG